MKRDQEPSGAEKAGSRPDPALAKGASTTPSRAPALLGLQRSAGNRAVADRMESTAAGGPEALAVQRTLDSALQQRLQGATDEDIADTIVEMFKGSGLNTTAAKYAGSSGKGKVGGGTSSNGGKVTKLSTPEDFKTRKAQLEAQLKGETAELTADEKQQKEIEELEGQVDAKTKKEAREKEMAEMERKLTGQLTDEEKEQLKSDEEYERLKGRLAKKSADEKRAKEIGELENGSEADIESEAKLNYLREKHQKELGDAKWKLENKEIAAGFSTQNINLMMQNDAVKNNPMLQKWANMKRKPKK